MYFCKDNYVLLCYVKSISNTIQDIHEKNDFRWDDIMKTNACDRKTYYDKVVVCNFFFFLEMIGFENFCWAFFSPTKTMDIESNN